MRPPQNSTLGFAIPRLVLSCIWVIGFLASFFGLVLPNTSTGPDNQITRTDIWKIIFVDCTKLLNPFDYSTEVPNEAGWHTLGQRLPFIVVAGFLLLCAWAIGRCATHHSTVMLAMLKSERFVIESGIGISLLTLWIFLCGVSGFLSKVTIGLPVLSIVFTCLTWHSKARFTNAASKGPALPPVSQDKTLQWLWLLAVPFVLHLFLGGMTPPFDFDVREYHMQGPKEWFQAGRITTLEHNAYTSFPFLSEMLSMGAMVLHGDWWQGAISGKLALSAFQILSAICAYAIATRWCSRTSGIIAAIAVLSTPWTLRISVIAYAEGAASFFLVSSVMVALLAQSVSDVSAKQQLWMLTGFLAGSAMAAKYPGVLSTVIPVGLFLVMVTCLKRKSADTQQDCSRAGQAVRFSCVFALAVIAAVGPWLIKNAVATGNPVYPLAYNVFGASDWSDHMDAKWKRAHSSTEHDVTRIVPYHLWDVAARSDWQNGLLFAFAVPSLFLMVKFAAVRWIWLHVAWFLATWWAFTHRIDRFWVPVIPLLAVLAGAVWHLSESRFWRVFVQATLIVCCVFNYGFCRLPIVGFHAGLTDIESLRKQPVRHDIAALNESLPPNSRVLMVGEAEVFDTHFDVVYSTVFDECIFEQWTSEAGQSDIPPEERKMKSPESIRDVFADNDITHIYVNWAEILRYRITYRHEFQGRSVSGYTPYIFPERFQQLQLADVISSPRELSNGEWARLDSTQQRDVMSWPGHQQLRPNEMAWTTMQLYEVR